MEFMYYGFPYFLYLVNFMFHSTEVIVRYDFFS